MIASIVRASVFTIVAFGLSVFFIYREQIINKEITDTYFKKNVLILFLVFVTMGLYNFWLFGFTMDFIFLLALETYLVSIVPEDVKERKISNFTTLAFIVIFTVLKALTLDVYQMIDSFAGWITGFVSLGIPYLIKKEMVGFGDVLAVACCGIMLGCVGIVQFLIRAFAFIVIFSVIQLIRKKVKMSSEMPFAPFLLMAALF